MSMTNNTVTVCLYDKACRNDRNSDKLCQNGSTSSVKIVLTGSVGTFMARFVGLTYFNIDGRGLPQKPLIDSQACQSVFLSLI